MVFESLPGHLKHYASFLKPLDVPASEIDESPYICLRLNEEWLPFIIGSVDVLRHRDLYTGSDEDKDAALQQVERLFLALMSGNILCPEDTMIQLRQNPSDPCQLEISYDAGSSWLLAFDHSLCGKSERTVEFTVDNSETVYNYTTTTMTTYEGDITNVYEDWGYGDDDDVFRDAVLCWAAYQWVDLVCELAIKLKQAENEEDKDLLEQTGEVLKAVGTLVAYLVAEAVFPAYAIYAALAFHMAGYSSQIAGVLIEADVADFQNGEDKEEVACTIYNAMRGDTPTFAAWQDSLLIHGLPGAAGRIADVSWLWMQSEESYVMYFTMMGDMIEPVRLGLDLGCPCDGEWVHVWEFDEASGSGEHTTYDNDSPQWEANYGEYNLGEGGWISEETIQAQYADERVVVKIPLPSRTLTRVRVDCDYQEGYIAPSNMGKKSLIIFFMMGSLIEVASWPFAYQENGKKNFTWTGNKTGVTNIRVFWRCSYDPDTEEPTYGDGHVTLERVAVEGKGTCPFDV